MTQKRIFAVCAAAFAAVLLYSNAYLPLSRTGRVQNVRGFAAAHQAQLEGAVQAAVSGQRPETLEVDGAADIGVFQGGTMVQFTLGGSGFGTSTGYWGVYWSQMDEPLAFQGAAERFAPSGDGWVWQEPYQDNRGYTERISPCWYYFEAYF